MCGTNTSFKNKMECATKTVNEISLSLKTHRFTVHPMLYTRQTNDKTCKCVSWGENKEHHTTMKETESNVADFQASHLDLVLPVQVFFSPPKP